MVETKKLTTLVGAALALYLGGATAQAALLTIDLDTEFSGATEPEGPGPWATATFEDIVDGVRLTMSTAGLTDAEFIDGANSGSFGWGFNFDPGQAASLGSLIFSPVGGNDADNIARGENAFQADGDGQFDIVFSWNPNSADQLTAGQTSVYDITGVTGLGVSDFNFGSEPGGGNGTWTSAAHVQGIGVDDSLSGWIGGNPNGGPGPGNGVPEPGILVLLGIGLAGLSLTRRFKF